MPAKLDPVNAIALLGFIEEEPRSGYELKQAIDDRLENILEITAGTVYYTLKRLEGRGWIRGTVSRSGRRPERRTYRITPDGKRAFAHLLEEAAFQEDRMLSPFDVVLYFTPRLPRDLLEGALEKRLARLEHFRAGLRRLEGRFPERWPFHLYYLREKAREVADANERWWIRLKRKIQDKATVKG